MLELPPACFPVGSELGFADDNRAGCGAATNRWTKVGGALHPPRGHDTDKLIRNPAMLPPHAIYFIIVDHRDERHQWSVGDVQGLTEALKQIPALREQFYREVKVIPNKDETLNQTL